MAELRRAFAMPGGGSLGSVQVGMLEAALDFGLEPDLIVGASAGAINGAYLAGRPDRQGVAELRRLWAGLRRSDVFPVSPLHGLGSVLGWDNHLIQPDRLRRLIERNLPYRDLEAAALPCHVVTADLLSGEEVVLSSGPAVPAVMASAAIPGVFPPVEHAGRTLVDGGLATGSPLAVAAALGARHILVLPVGFSCALEREPDTAIGMALHGLNLLIARQLVVEVERFADQVDVAVVPPPCPLAAAPYDFSHATELMDAAAHSAREWLEAGGLDRATGIPGELRPHAIRG